MDTNFSCALVYLDGQPSWQNWENPSFDIEGNPDLNWANWVKASPGRTLVISLEMLPPSVATSDPNWLVEGAAGAFTPYATQLAENLVAAGLGSSVIRLGWEANGTWYKYSLGTTQLEWTEWAEFWRQTALAMNAVQGANFKFDWTVNAAYRDIPLADWYPGDDVVDIIGVDAYDSGISSTYDSDRWSRVLNQPGGLGTVLAFAQAHHKPLSIPEWGLQPATSGYGGNDDAGYVNGIANVVADDDVAYQSYFFNGQWATALGSYAESLDSYQNAFGGGAGNEIAGSVTKAIEDVATLDGNTNPSEATLPDVDPNGAQITAAERASRVSATKRSRVSATKRSRVSATTRSRVRATKRSRVRATKRSREDSTK